MQQSRPIPDSTERVPVYTSHQARQAHSGEVRVGVAQWIGSRERQEDAFAVLDSPDPAIPEPTAILAIVADGMGGMEHGDAASHTAIATFLRSWQRDGSMDLAPQSLSKALSAANAKVCGLAKSMGCLGEMGCTLVAASIHADALHWIAVGDSDLLLVRDGDITVLNTPHTYAEELDSRVARGEISNCTALTDSQRTALTSFLGLDPLPFADRTLRPFPLLPGDCILIASDGIRNALSESEILAIHRQWFVSANGQPQSLAEHLVTAVQGKMLPGQDNTTVIAIAISTPSPELVGTPSWSAAPEQERRHVEQAEAGIRAGTPILATGWRTSANAEVGRSRLYSSILARLLAVVVGAGLILLGLYFAPHRKGSSEIPRGTESKAGAANATGSVNENAPEAETPTDANVTPETDGRNGAVGEERPSPLSPTPGAAIPAKSEALPERRERK